LSALAQSKSPWTPLAEFQLARIDLQENRPGECVQRCRKLLYQPTTLETAALLGLLGQALERLGQHDQAARCFAGQFPE
jgi:hypothetical protein